MDAVEHINELMEEAKKYNQRRMIVLAGDRKYSFSIISQFLEYFKGKGVFISSIEEEIEGLENYHLKDSSKLLGTTYDFLIIDVYYSLQPSDIGKLYGIVRGGGLIFLITPELEKWKNMINKYHLHLITPPYTKKDLRKIFVKWFVKKLLQHDGIAIIENGEIKKRGNFGGKVKRKKEIKIPSDTIFDEGIYRYAITQDQIKFIKKFEEFMKNKRMVMVLKANRGRGKSSVIGISLAAMTEKRKRSKIILIAPDIKNVDEIFRFVEKVMKERGYDVVREGRKMLIKGKATIEYFPPFDAFAKKADFIAVDEAASIPPHLLLHFLENAPQIIYSSTVHGYEGAGRSFTIRFLERLKKMNVKSVEIEMTEPIRYSMDDPIEKWAFDSLLLDAEPVDIKDTDLKNIEYGKIDIEKILENEDEIKQFFGILIMAHYRNNPNDFAILCDAPNQFARVLKNGKNIVCSMQLAFEGGLGKDDSDEIYYRSIMIPGNIIPQALIRHYRRKKYGNFRGIRVVRIAVHPSLFDRGIGSEAIKHLEEEAKSMDRDYIGSSFGATLKLLNFWRKNGFVPIHITTSVNSVSGEHSVIVIKPLTTEFEKEIEKIQASFISRFIYWLIEPLRDLNSKLALEIIESYEGEKLKPKLTDEEMKRIAAYIWDGLTYRTVKDCLFKLTYYFFLSSDKKILDEKEKLLLLTKNLQCKSWERVSDIVKCPVRECREMLKNAVKKLIMHYYGGWDEISKFQEKIQGEH